MTDQMAERCERSDLPPEMCAHCQPQVPWVVLPPLTEDPVRVLRRAQVLLPIWPPVAAEQHEARDWRDGAKPPSKASPCHWVEGWGYYLPEHAPTCRARTCNGCKECTHDEHGTPVRHCTARDTCTEHLDDAHPLTCPRCIGRVRANLAHIERLSALMPDQAVANGIESSAANLAGPVADPARVDEIRFWVDGHATHAYRTGRIDGETWEKILAALPDNDDKHPRTLLWKWERMLREDYDQPTERPFGIASSVSYLSWLLTDMAQDGEQDFTLFAREVAACMSHLETVLGASRAPERGAPCWRCPEHKAECINPLCAGCGKPRLQRRRAHWCESEDCTRQHDETGARDTWTCPTNAEHWWYEADYRQATYTDALDVDSDAQRASGFKPTRRPA